MLNSSIRNSRGYTLNRDNANSADVCISDFTLPCEIYSFPRQTEIPAGYYFSEIKDVAVRTTARGKKCLDVYYDLLGFQDGEYKMKLSYPEGSRPLYELYAAMRKAGVPSGVDMSAAIGITEKIRLVYDEEGGIGRIDKRVYDPVEDEEVEYQKEEM